jgi:hypothetical protein
MKPGVILATAALSMAGATGAHLLRTSYQDAPVGAPAAAKPIQKASLEVGQTPVPLQMKPRPPAKLPTVDATEAPAKSEAAPSQTSASGSAASSSNPITENTAQLEADRSATSRRTVRIFVGDVPRAPDRRGAGVEPDGTMAAAVRAADLWRAGYAVEIVLSKAPAKSP